MPDPAQRWGILGGTFDPPHVAHVVAAVSARFALALDRVLLVVAADPWQKRGDVVAPAEERLALAAALCRDVPGLEASDLELQRSGPTYTIDTLELLTAPARELVLVCGTDVAARLSTWHRAHELGRYARVAVVGRGDDAVPDAAALGLRIDSVAMPRLDVSSTEIRRRLATGEPVDGLVPPRVLRLIRERGLYTPTR